MRGLRYLSIFLCFITADALIDITGKLTKTQNRFLQAGCGRISQFGHDYDGLFYHDKSFPNKQKFMTSISQRHIIVDVNAEFLNFSFDQEKDNCYNNIIEFDVSLKDLQESPFNALVNKAYYIGSCDAPRGFVLLEYHPGFPIMFSPVCLSEFPLAPETNVQVLVTRNVTLQSVDYIYTKVQNGQFSDQMVTENFVEDFGGPVLDPKFGRRTSVGYAYGHEDGTILIAPIYQYIDQICETTGICVGEEKETIENRTPLFLTFHDDTNDKDVEVEEPKIEVSFGSTEDFKINPFNEVEQGEIIDLSEIEFEMEEESSGENLIIFDSEEALEKPLNFISAVPLEKFDSSEIPEENSDGGTVVRAEPFSAIIIPLPGTEIVGHQKTIYPSSTELLIAFLIMLSVFFYVCMCIHGCVDKPETGRLPV